MINETIAGQLISWFKIYGRAFSFRWQRDPYYVLIAGVLLRQTQASQVDPIFPKLMEAYPSLDKLANANEDVLMQLIKPLGITSRSRTLIQICREILQEYDGTIPHTYQELISLPGIGDYIASCVMTLAFEEPMPMIDINVKRVMRRIFEINETEIHTTYCIICPIHSEEIFHYAILDFAQLVCKASKPKCDKCCINGLCSHHILSL